MVTVLLPVYNCEKYIGEAIESILRQTYKDFELLIIDDGSTDKTIEIVRSYNDSRIVLHQNDQNSGLIFTLNKGILMSKTPYISRMDADDICLPERLEKQIAFLKNNPEHVAVCGQAFKIDAKGKRIGSIKPSFTDESIKYSLLFSNSKIIHPTVTFNRLLLPSDPYKKSYYVAEDYALWVSLLQKGHKIGIIEEEVLEYRIHSENISKLKTNEKIKSIKLIMKDYFNYYSIKPTERETILHSVYFSRDIEIVENFGELIEWTEKLFNKVSANVEDKLACQQFFFTQLTGIYLKKYKKNIIKIFGLLNLKSPISDFGFLNKATIIAQVAKSKMAG